MKINKKNKKKYYFLNNYYITNYNKKNVLVK